MSLAASFRSNETLRLNNNMFDDAYAKTCSWLEREFRGLSAWEVENIAHQILLTWLQEEVEGLLIGVGVYNLLVEDHGERQEYAVLRALLHNSAQQHMDGNAAAAQGG